MADASLPPSWRLDRRIAAALENAADADPFAVLGPHDTPDGRVVRAFVPGGLGVEVLNRADRAPLGRLDQLETGAGDFGSGAFLPPNMPCSQRSSRRPTVRSRNAIASATATIRHCPTPQAIPTQAANQVQAALVRPRTRK